MAGSETGDNDPPLCFELDVHALLHHGWHMLGNGSARDGCEIYHGESQRLA
ncbi:hypothetical protein [Ensifer sp. SL37]|uniref:hypothetical protein n=1 Tax=Ensifer sp. SL37 TaxID=2995137 RepID=UPI002274E43B|nr:hypothetical protein [Ensifer sp. SL37]MCY1745818.1 hypothetical protein [Ensifer sp. SL37]